MPNHPAYPRVLMLVAAAACWGGGTVVSKQALDDIAPLTLLPMQLSASTLFLFAMKHVTRSPTEWSSQLLRLAALGMLNPGMAYALGLLGLVSITASMSVLLWALNPVLIVLLAALLLRERVPPALALAMAAALVGVLLIVYQAGAAGDTTGVLLTVAAVGACALYTVAARRLLLDDASVTVALVQQATALVFAVTLFLVVHVVGSDPGTRTSQRGRLDCSGGIRDSLLRVGVLVLSERAQPGTRHGCRCVPAAHPGVRGGCRLPRRRAAHRSSVDRSRRGGDGRDCCRRAAASTGG